ncbi:glutamate--cysteine ligase [Marinimicrobium sp. ARAG 43.8]|uniref:glutamate--cysteine ligase n=1 Tax=Marinimicrobium sp. ARAG 43.8 TaxID=3418719 RepID=UPI003CF5C01B
MSQTSRLHQHLRHFSQQGGDTLKGILRGVEKESLRVTPGGDLAQGEHPRDLGSALTHPHITTDYSEALLEFITEPFTSVEALLGQLDDIHRYTYSVLDGEWLWPASMPCALKGDEGIPVAQYGRSNSGTMKTVYRLGLAHRYGRTMQTIAGVHYNFSLPDQFWRELQALEGDAQSLQDFKTERYFDLIRNFRRYSWLLIYLFGAAPAVCRSFVRNRQHRLEPFNGDEHTLHAPYATSLRMGDLGYQSDAQQSMIVCYNDIASYLQTLCGAITQPHAAYEAIGLKDESGGYQQLNTSLLQIENEFYSSVRPKRTTQRGETALQALRLRGVEYVEVRCVDLNPFEPLGISAEQIHFLDAFLLFCLLRSSPKTHNQEYRNIQENQERIVYRGREPGLKLCREDGEVLMNEWAHELLAAIRDCAVSLDASRGQTDTGQASVAAQQRKLDDPELTPSARVLAGMRREQQTFFRYTMTQAQQHGDRFRRRPLAADMQAHYRAMAAKSLQDQRAVEAADTLSFEDYLANYYRQYRRCGDDTDPSLARPLGSCG